ncbi:SusC/RagA family TonB-linked outer membrane protein [Hymenobacter nivis]|uniref:SusC/RagA family TonB-linked outer membrane protein n=1 Tax=Hymenobacter nivis TaxID=1850093 RepID=A0A2Z3GJ16_9BACT|nr:TonB-dependent receptor [Hymenobacter nivis]AWM32241.1 SusC/RagA family TonB-linked outer membrane protein [Hymenobacter nivis]
MQAKSLLLCGALLPLTVAAAPATPPAAPRAVGPALRHRAVAATPITGTVLDEKGAGLPGVTIVLKGTTTGATTDENGRFSLIIPDGVSGATLVVSSIGYDRKEVAVGSQATFSITLSPNSQSLDEAVVIGYGTQEKRNLTNAVTTVSGAELSKITVSDVGSALQGKAAGVTVVGAGSEPGSAPQILIRGISTINGNSPLYVVDGLPVANINYLNPKDIATLTVLKDASSAAIYGSRAANGVILITTKAGVKGESRLTFDATYGVSNPTNVPHMASASEYARIMNLAATNSGNPAVYVNPDQYTQTTDWWKEIAQHGITQNYSVGLSGGSDKVVYSTGLSYFKERGLVRNSNFDRLSFRVKTEYQAAEHLKVGEDFNISMTSQNYLNNGSLFRDAFIDDPITSPRVAGTSGNPYDYYGASPTDAVNPLAFIERNDDRRKQYFVVGTVYANYEFLPGLIGESRFGSNNNVYQRDAFNPFYTIDANERNQVNSVVREHNLEINWNNTNTLNYTHSFGDHNISALAAFTLERFQTNTEYASGQAIPSNDPSLRYPDAATSGFAIGGNRYTNTIASLIGRINYDYKGKYLLGASIRRDGASVFPDGNRWGTFPAVSVGWLVSEENFLKDMAAINFLKVRASVGRVGNQNIANLTNSAYTGNIAKTYYVTGPDRALQLGAVQSNVPNPNVKWETVEDYNLGLDLGFLQNRLTVTADFFRRNTYDMLMFQAIPSSAGYGYNSPVTNIGSMNTKGFDFTVGYAQNTGAFTYGLSVNATRAISRIDKLANGQAIYSGNTPVFGRPSKTEEGGYVGAFYGYQNTGIFQNQGEIDAYKSASGTLIQPNAKPGDFRFADLNGDGVIDEKDQQYIGNPTPKLTFGVNLNLGYKGFDLQASLIGSLGNDLVNANKGWWYSGSYNYNKIAGLENLAWHGEGTSNSVPRIVANDNNQNLTRFSNFYVENGSYARLRNLQLGYTFPKAITSVLHTAGLRLYVSTQNLLTFTKYSGVDPEVGNGRSYTDGAGALNRGVDLGNYPTARTYLVGTNITF